MRRLNDAFDDTGSGFECESAVLSCLAQTASAAALRRAAKLAADNHASAMAGGDRWDRADRWKAAAAVLAHLADQG